MPLDPSIYGGIDQQAPNKLAAIFDPTVIQARQLKQAQERQGMAQIARASKLQELLGSAQSADPAQMADTLAKNGFADEAMKYQGMQDAAQQRKDAELTRRQALGRAAFGNIAAEGGTPEAVQKHLSALPWMKPEEVAAAAQAAAAIPEDQRLDHFMGLHDPNYIAKKREAEAARLEKGEQAAAQREERARLEQMRLEEQRRAREEQNALRRDLVREQIVGRNENAKLIAGLKPPPPEKALTEAQGNAALFGARAAEADKILNDLGGDYSVAGLSAKRLVENVPGVNAVVNAMSSPKTQKAEQAQRDFINAVLRKESGAAIGASEFANAQKQYFAQPGDSKEVIEQKNNNRRTAIQGLRVMSGPGAERMDAAIGSQQAAPVQRSQQPAKPAGKAPTVSNW